MCKHHIIKFDPIVPAKFADWFGAPAGLTAEDLRIHDRILCGLFHDVKPHDFIECILIHDLAYNVWRRLALRRRRDKVIRHAYNEKFERQERELLQHAEHRKEDLRAALAIDKSDVWFHPRERQPQTKRAIELEAKEAKTNQQLAEINAETNKKLAELQKAKEGPIDEAASFDQWIDKVVRIDEEEAMMDQNIRITLKLLDEHRAGLGQRLRQAADEIIDVEVLEESATAREEAVGPVEACSTEASKALTGPMTASSVAEPSSPASSQTNGGALLQLDGPLGSALPPSSGPTEQR